MREKEIGIILRKKLPVKNSIEEVFATLMDNLRDSANVDIKKIHLPHARANLSSMLGNLSYVRKFSCNLFHMTGDAHYVIIPIKVPVVLTIHDVQSALRGNVIKQLLVKIFWFWLPAMRAKKITVISNFSKSELLKLVPFAKSKIRVIHNPINPAVKFCQKEFNTNKPTILHLGTKPNKNLERTIRALKGVECSLDIIGPLAQSQIKLLAQCNIQYTNSFNITYEEIIVHYKNSDIVSFVSTYEGFGMPIIEGQMTGRPIITSNIASLPEIAGEGACFVNPLDEEEIRASILRIIEDESYRDHLILKGRENVKRFDPITIANQYLQVYGELLSTE